MPFISENAPKPFVPGLLCVFNGYPMSHAQTVMLQINGCLPEDQTR